MGVEEDTESGLEVDGSALPDPETLGQAVRQTQDVGDRFDGIGGF